MQLEKNRTGIGREVKCKVKKSADRETGAQSFS
jgi:hypothetical protein